MVAFAETGCDEAAFNRPAVYKNELLRPRLPAQACLPDKAANLNLVRSSAAYLNEALQQLNAIQISDTITERCRGW